MKWGVCFFIPMLFFFSYHAQSCEIKEVDLQDDLKIASWNVQRLGKTKMSKPQVVNVFIKVIELYDIVVLEEVSDSTGKSQRQLLTQINEALGDNNKNYSLVESPRIGSTRYKEQYVFYYRNKLINVLDTYKYPDESDVFQIEPFSVLFEVPTMSTKKFALIPIHTSPSSAPTEIDALLDAYEATTKKFGIKDAIILGDFNAGCSYVSQTEWETIRLRHDSRFNWLISDHIDTTTKGSSCPYDRIVVAGDSLQSSVYVKSAKPFYFDEKLAIMDKELVYDVSDHYPVEVSAKGNHNLLIDVAIGLSVEVSSSKTAIDALKQDTDGVDQQNSVITDDVLVIRYKEKNLKEISPLLGILNSNHPCIFTNEVKAAFEYKLAKGVLVDGTLYGEHIPTTVNLSVLCLSNRKCTIRLESPTKIN